jgi:F0F1-type ATP synthase assembly protein I
LAIDGPSHTLLLYRLMTYYLIKLLAAAALIVAVTEVSRLSPAWGGLIKSLPLVSLIALCWVYAEQRNTAAVADLAQSTLWFVIPSLPFFLALPWLLRRGVAFGWSFVISLVLMVICYLAAAAAARRVGIDLGI